MNVFKGILLLELMATKPKLILDEVYRYSLDIVIWLRFNFCSVFLVNVSYHLSLLYIFCSVFLVIYLSIFGAFTLKSLHSTVYNFQIYLFILLGFYWHIFVWSQITIFVWWFIGGIDDWQSHIIVRYVIKSCIGVSVWSIWCTSYI